MEHLLVIRPDGTIEFIYDDTLRPVLEAGEGGIRRASWVEPTAGGLWQANLRPSDGPVLPPTASRSESLSLEVRWLQANVLLRP